MIKRTEQEIMQNWIGDKCMPLVSICTVTFNHEKYIAEALDSFLMQETDFPFEVVVDEDSSTDNTKRIIELYNSKYPNILKVKLREKNIGMMLNFIENIQRAKGKYIAICEGDDYWTDSKKLQLQIDEMRKYPGVNLSFHPANEIVNSTLSGKIWGNHQANNKIFTDLEMMRNIGNVFCPTASMIFCREVLNPIPDFFYKAPVIDIFLQYLSSLSGGALFIANNMSIYRRENIGSWTTVMREQTNNSKIEKIEKIEKFTYKLTKSLSSMGDILDKKYLKEINKKISIRLFDLALLYLDNYRFREFRITIVQSYKAYKISSFSQFILYHFRFASSFVRKLIKLKS